MSWPSIRIFPLGNVVEAKQQPRDRRLAGAGGTDDRNRLAGRHFEAETLEDRPLRIIGKAHVLEAHIARGHRERFRAGNVLDLGRTRQHIEHLLDVDDRLSDLAIDESHEVQRHKELDHHGVDHHEVADRVCAITDRESAHQHGRRQSGGEDHGLSGVENRKRSIGADARLFVALHRVVIAPGFAFLRAEIFHGLIIEQRVRSPWCSPRCRSRSSCGGSRSATRSRHR